LANQVHDSHRLLNLLRQSWSGPAVLAESRECSERHGANRVRANQLLDIERVSLAWVIGACVGPQQALWLCAAPAQGLPPIAAENSELFLVGSLGTGDGDLAQQGPQHVLLAGVPVGTLQLPDDKLATLATWLRSPPC